MWKQFLGMIASTGILYFCIQLEFMILYKLKGQGELLKILWGYDSASGIYGIITKIYNEWNDGKKLLWIIFYINLFIIFVLLYVLLQKFVKKKLLIIEHLSLQNMNFTYVEEELKECSYKKYRINQYEILNNTSLGLNEKINKLIESINYETTNIIEYIKKGYQIGYAGIANIPAIFMLGYELGDENKKIFFHKRRDRAYDDDFHLLQEEDRIYDLKLVESKNNRNENGKLLVLIEFTQPIEDDDIQEVLESNDYILKYSLGVINYDVVDTAKQINEYTNKIISDIGKIQKQSNINEIKICVAASSAFIFALGTKFSKTQNIDTVIYHFQNNTYPWGINVTKGIPVITK